MLNQGTNGHSFPYFDTKKAVFLKKTAFEEALLI